MGTERMVNRVKCLFRGVLEEKRGVSGLGNLEGGGGGGVGYGAIRCDADERAFLPDLGR